MAKPSSFRDSIISLHKKGVPAWSIRQRLGVTKQLVLRTIKRFKSLGTNQDRKGRGRRVTSAVETVTKNVRERIRLNPERSVRQMAREMKVPVTSMHRIVRKRLGMKAFKKNRCHGITDAAKIKREHRCAQLLARFPGQAHRRILFTDEKVFTVQQVLNKQNDRIYGISNPHKSVSHSLHPTSVMVFAGITYDGKTPLIFVPAGVKIKANNYLDVLKNEVLPWSKKHFGRKRWVYQQDGAPAHKAGSVQDWCDKNFPDFIGFNEWPPMSPDLNPLDYSVWAVLEAKACQKPHKTLDSLKKALQKAWDELDLPYLRATVDDFPKRLQLCVNAKGGHIE